MKTHHSRLSLFWILQISGWLVYWAVHLFASTTFSGWTFYSFVRYTTSSFSGFLVTLLLRILFKRFGYRGRSILSITAMGLAYSLLAANLLVWLSNIIRLPLWGAEGTLFGDLTALAYTRKVFWWILPFIGWTTLYFAVKFIQEGKIQREQAEKARALAQSAQLQMLRYRLNPHFLFNSLNSIRALIREDRTKARNMITELSEFLRYSLISRKFPEVPLKDEIEALRHYLSIEKNRYENKLETSFRISGETGDYPILSFLLYPLVENALKFGMLTSPMPLEVRVDAEVVDDVLSIDIRNSGHWMEPSKDKEDLGGSGLDNVGRRLQEHYPGRHSVETGEENGYVLVRIRIHFPQSVKS